MRGYVQIGLLTTALVLGGLGWWWYNVSAGGIAGKPLAINPTDSIVPPAEPTPTPVQVAVADLPTPVPTPTVIPATPVPVVPPIEALPTPIPPTPAIEVAVIAPTPEIKIEGHPLAGHAEPIIHYSEPGESLTAIAGRFSVPLEWLTQANPKLAKPTATLKTGTKVVVPDRPPAVAVVATPAPGQTPVPIGEAKTYTVVQGDSLWVIAKKVYGSASEARVHKIQAANSKVLGKGAKLKPGMQLVIPAE